eukprot:11222877-Lingulodinium_polyedra.AAC.1
MHQPLGNANGGHCAGRRQPRSEYKQCAASRSGYTVAPQPTRLHPYGASARMEETCNLPRRAATP